MNTSRLSKVVSNADFQITKINGAVFRGRILDIPDTSRVSNYNSSKRYLKVLRDCKVYPRDVIIIDNDKYIVAEHGSGFESGINTALYIHFKLLKVDKIFQWFKVSKSKNSITGIMETTRVLQSASVYASTTIANYLEDSIIQIQREQATAIVNQDVLRDDLLDSFVVTTSSEVIGTNFITYKEI